MRIGIEFEEREIDRILNILNKIEEENLFNLITLLLEKNVSCSDLLFIILEILEKNKIVSGRKGKIVLNKKIEEKEKAEIKNRILRQTKNINKIFVTPLEVSKFYLCPRRLWLEKVVLAKQEKERRGRVWDGEAIHLAANLLFKQLPRYDFEKIVNAVFKNYKNKLTLQKEQILEFLEGLLAFIEEERITKIFSERTLKSLRIGLVGTPDGIIIKGNDVFPLDIKLGIVRKLRKEHILQSTGEALLVQEFFRKNVQKSYLIYFSSNSIVELNFTPQMKREFINYKKRIEKMFSSAYIPRMSNLVNFRRRVCQGCHVKKACDLIEALRKRY